MGTRGVGEGIALVDVDLHLAGSDDGEQLGGCGLKAGGLGDVGEQSRASQNSEPFCASSDGEKSAIGPDDWPKLTISPRGARQSNERRKLSFPTES